MIKAIKIIAAAICVVSGAILAVFLLPVTGLKAMSVLTGSMDPAIPQGSLIVIKREPISQLKSGDVVTYINPSNPKQTITHRVVEIKSNGLPTLITKGDANQVADKEIMGGNVVGKVIWHYPEIGQAFSYARGWPLLIIFVFIPAAFIIFDEIRLLRRSLKRSEIEPKNQKNDHDNKPPRDSLPDQARPRKHPSSIDGLIKRAVFVLFIFIATSGVGWAALFSQASLIGNTISVNSQSGNNPCGQGENSATITNTGPGSINDITFNNNCSIYEENTNNINIINNNQQTSSGGEATNSNNTNTTVNIQP